MKNSPLHSWLIVSYDTERTERPVTRRLHRSEEPIRVRAEFETLNALSQNNPLF